MPCQCCSQPAMCIFSVGSVPHVPHRYLSVHHWLKPVWTCTLNLCHKSRCRVTNQSTPKWYNDCPCSVNKRNIWDACLGVCMWQLLITYNSRWRWRAWRFNTLPFFDQVYMRTLFPAPSVEEATGSHGDSNAASRRTLGPVTECWRLTVCFGVFDFVRIRQVLERTRVLEGSSSKNPTNKNKFYSELLLVMATAVGILTNK